MPSRAGDWLNQAKRDLEHAESDLKNKFYEWACFSAQQAAEKAIKALFYSMNASAWGHSITMLLKELTKHYEIDAFLLEAAKNLDKFYIPPRYPNGFDIGIPGDYFTLKDAQGAIEDARKIIQFCESNLSEQ